MKILKPALLMRSRANSQYTRLAVAMFAAGVALLAAPATAVHAENGKTYPAGAMCQPYLTEEGMRFYVDGAYNVDASSAYVLCPIVKDEVTSTAGLNSAYVWYYKPQTTQILNCALYSYNSDSSYGFTKYRTDSSSTPGRKKFTFDKTANYSSGNYSMVCELPLGGSLYSYQINER